MNKGSNKAQGDISQNQRARPTLGLQHAPAPRGESSAFLTSSPFIRRASANSSKMDTRSLGRTEGPWNFLLSSIFRIGNFMIIFSAFMASG